MITKLTVHLVMVAVWGAYAILVGSMAIVFGYGNNLVWDSIIVAVTANSVHLVTLSLSKTGVEITSNPSTFNQEKLTSQNLRP